MTTFAHDPRTRPAPVRHALASVQTTTPQPTVPQPAPAGVAPTDPVTAQSVTEWNVELDRLEVEVLWAERLLKVAEPLDRDGWEPPVGLPPLPRHLEDRARALLSRQTQVRLDLMAAMSALVRGQSYEESSTASASDERPRYVDVVG